MPKGVYKRTEKHTPWNKGKKYSLGVSSKIECKCLNCGTIFKAYKNNGRKYCSKSCSNKHNPTKYWLGKKRSPISEGHRKIISLTHKGTKRSEETKDKMRGKNNPSWKGGVTPINMKIRNSKEYKIWREAVFERDNYTCRFCGERGGKLNADHIKPFAYFPELRLAIDNGRTLCVSCHKKTDTYLNRWSNKNN